MTFPRVAIHFLGGNSRSFRVFQTMHKDLIKQLSEGNSRSITLFFVLCFSVLLFCFDAGSIKHPVTQRVSYSFSLVRYTRAQNSLLQKNAIF